MKILTKSVKRSKNEPILFEKGNSDYLLVTFGGLQQGFGLPPFEFYNSMKEINSDKLYIRDFQQAWYHKGIDKDINNIEKLVEYLAGFLQSKKYKQITFLGNSMGGYAAILLGTLLNVDQIISFAPQTFIDTEKRAKFNDTRWSEEINSIYNFDDKEEQYFDLSKYLNKSDYSSKIKIYYSGEDKYDVDHIENVLDIKNISIKSIPEGGHSVVKKLRDQGELQPIIRNSFGFRYRFKNFI